MKHLTELQWFEHLPKDECEIARKAFFEKNKPSEYFDSLLEALKSIDMELVQDHADLSENKAFPTIADYFNSVVEGLGDAIFKTITHATDFVHDQGDDEFSNEDFDNNFGDTPDVELPPQEVKKEPSLVTQIGKFIKIQNSAVIQTNLIKHLAACPYNADHIKINTWSDDSIIIKCSPEDREQIIEEIAAFLPTN
jgi:hypothetical protein